jgi:uncharacterized membrane protein
MLVDVSFNAFLMSLLMIGVFCALVLIVYCFYRVIVDTVVIVYNKLTKKSK